MNKRIFIQKKPSFEIHSRRVTKELKNLVAGIECKVFVIYDVFHITENQLKDSLFKVFADPVTDIAYHSLDEIVSNGKDIKYFASELLPGQYDQRGDSAEQCLQLIGLSNLKFIQPCFTYLKIFLMKIYKS